MMSRGHYLQTFTGKAFYPLDPRPEDICIEDIAHALTYLCRFGGHCKRFYSVAEHSWNVAESIHLAGYSDALAFEGLMHDAAEAYVGDMVWPLKNSEGLEAYKAIDDRIDLLIRQKYGLPEKMSAVVKRYDLVMLSTEKRDLTSEPKTRTTSEGRATLEAGTALEKLGPWVSDDFAPLDYVRLGDVVAPLPMTVQLQFMHAFKRFGGYL